MNELELQYHQRIAQQTKYGRKWLTETKGMYPRTRKQWERYNKEKYLWDDLYNESKLEENNGIKQHGELQDT